MLKYERRELVDFWLEHQLCEMEENQITHELLAANMLTVDSERLGQLTEWPGDDFLISQCAEGHVASVQILRTKFPENFKSVADRGFMAACQVGKETVVIDLLSGDSPFDNKQESEAMQTALLHGHVTLCDKLQENGFIFPKEDEPLRKFVDQLVSQRAIRALRYLMQKEIILADFPALPSEWSDLWGNDYAAALWKVFGYAEGFEILEVMESFEKPTKDSSKLLQQYKEIMSFVQLFCSVNNQQKSINTGSFAAVLTHLFGTLENVVKYLQVRNNEENDFIEKLTFKLPVHGSWHPTLWRNFLFSKEDGVWATQFIEDADKIEANLDSEDQKKLTRIGVLKAAARVKYGKAAADTNMALALLCYKHHITPEGFNTASKAVLKEDDLLPDIAIDGHDLGYPGFYFVKMQPGDLRGFVLGKLSQCCQSVGKNGERCALHGMTSINGGFYLLSRGDLKTAKSKDKFEYYEGKIVGHEDKIVAQTWAWIAGDGGIVCDSWEGFKDECGGSDGYAQMCAAFLSAAAHEVKQEGFPTLKLGTDGQTPPKNLPFEVTKKPGVPIDCKAYPDSKKQYLIPPSTYFIASLDDLDGSSKDMIAVVIHYAQLITRYSKEKNKSEYIQKYLMILKKINTTDPLKSQLNLAGTKLLELVLATKAVDLDQTEVDFLAYLARDVWNDIPEHFKENNFDLSEYDPKRYSFDREKVAPIEQVLSKIYKHAEKYASVALSLLYEEDLSSLLDAEQFKDTYSRKALGKLHEEVALEFVTHPKLCSGKGVEHSVSLNALYKMAMQEDRGEKVAMVLRNNGQHFEQLTTEQKVALATRFMAFSVSMIEDESFSDIFSSFNRRQQWQLIQHNCERVISRLRDEKLLFDWISKISPKELRWFKEKHFISLLAALYENERLISWLVSLSQGYCNDCIANLVHGIAIEDSKQRQMLMTLYRSEKVIKKLYAKTKECLQGKLYSIAKIDSAIAFQCGEVELERENRKSAREFFISAFAQGYAADEIYKKLLVSGSDICETAMAIYGPNAFEKFYIQAENDDNAKLICGSCYLHGQGGVEKDLGKALTFFQAVSEKAFPKVREYIDAARFSLLDDLITPLTRVRKQHCFFEVGSVAEPEQTPCRSALITLHAKKKALRASTANNRYEQLRQVIEEQIAFLAAQKEHKVCNNNLIVRLRAIIDAGEALMAADRKPIEKIGIKTKAAEVISGRKRRQTV